MMSTMENGERERAFHKWWAISPYPHYFGFIRITKYELEIVDCEYPFCWFHHIR